MFSVAQRLYLNTTCREQFHWSSMMSLNHRYSLLFISGHADCYPLFQWIFQVYFFCSFLFQRGNNVIQSNLSLRTPLYYGQFVWSQKCQKSYIPYLYNTETSVKRTLSSVILVSVLKRFDCTNLYVASVNTTQYGLRSLKFTGPCLWYSLPTSVTNSNSVRIFRKTRKNSILNRYSY